MDGEGGRRRGGREREGERRKEEEEEGNEYVEMSREVEEEK